TANIEDATNVVSLAATYTDAAGNAGGTATSANYQVDTKAPTATIVVADTALKTGETLVVRITFSEAVSGLDASDVTVENGTVGAITSADSGAPRDALPTSTANIEDATNVVSLAATYTDAAGNAGGTATSANYQVDTKAPTA